MKLKQMLERFDQAAKEYAWRGGGHPDDIPVIEQEYEDAKKDLWLNILVLRTALKDIRDTQGKVCEQFEICKHTSCTSSYSSWHIADQALK